MFKNKPILRKIIILSGFLAGVFLVLYGFFMTASAKGLLIMLLGVAALLLSLFVYNARYFVKKVRKK